MEPAREEHAVGNAGRKRAASHSHADMGVRHSKQRIGMEAICVVATGRASKKAMHFARSTSESLLEASGFGGLWYRLKTDRLMVLIRCLNSRNSYVKQVTEAAVFLEARAQRQWNLLREVEKGMMGEGIGLARRGFVGAPWIKLLMSFGHTKSKAKEVCDKLSKAIQSGCIGMWKIFCSEAAQDEGAGRYRVSDEVQLVFDEGLLSKHQMRVVRKLDPSQQDVWLDRFGSLKRKGNRTSTAFETALSRAKRVRDDGTSAISFEEWKAKNRRGREAERRARQRETHAQTQVSETDESDEARVENETQAYLMDTGRRRDAEVLAKSKAAKVPVRGVPQHLLPVHQQGRLGTEGLDGTQYDEQHEAQSDADTEDEGHREALMNRSIDETTYDAQGESSDDDMRKIRCGKSRVRDSDDDDGDEDTQQQADLDHRDRAGRKKNTEKKKFDRQGKKRAVRQSVSERSAQNSTQPEREQWASEVARRRATRSDKPDGRRQR